MKQFLLFRFTIFVNIIAAAALLMPVVAFAQFTTVPNPIQSTTGLYNILCNAANWFFSIVLVIAVITFLRGAVEFFNSGGNEQQLEKAKQFMKWAVVGVIVAILARSIVLVIGNVVGADTGGLFGLGCA